MLEIGKYYSLVNKSYQRFVIKVLKNIEYDYIIDYMNIDKQFYVDKYYYSKPILDTCKEITEYEYDRIT